MTRDAFAHFVAPLLMGVGLTLLAQRAYRRLLAEWAYGNVDETAELLRQAFGVHEYPPPSHVRLLAPAPAVDVVRSNRPPVEPRTTSTGATGPGKGLGRSTSAAASVEPPVRVAGRGRMGEWPAEDVRR